MGDRGSSSEAHMRRFWDRRAREDAFFFVDDRLEYGRPDEASFWQGGEEVLDGFLNAFGLDLGPGQVAVDVGCGIGRLTRPLARRVARVKALDVSPDMLEQARSYNRDLDNVEWLLGDGSSLAGVRDDSADVCLSVVTFQHIPDPEITLGYVREMGRALRPGGFALFQVSTDDAVHRPPGGRRRWLSELLRRTPRGVHDPAWLGSAIELDALRAAVRDGGMELAGMVGAGTQYCVVHARRA